MSRPQPGHELLTVAFIQLQHMEGFWKKPRPKRRRKYTYATGMVKSFQMTDDTSANPPLDDKNIFVSCNDSSTTEAILRGATLQKACDAGAFGGLVLH